MKKTLIILAALFLLVGCGSAVSEEQYLEDGTAYAKSLAEFGKSITETVSLYAKNAGTANESVAKAVIMKNVAEWNEDLNSKMSEFKKIKAPKEHNDLQTNLVKSGEQLLISSESFLDYLESNTKTNADNSTSAMEKGAGYLKEAQKLLKELRTK